MKGNPHYEVLAKGYTVEDTHDHAIVTTEAIMAITYATETANLMTFYNTPNLVESLTSAERHALEQQIIERLGAKDA